MGKIAIPPTPKLQPGNVDTTLGTDFQIDEVTINAIHRSEAEGNERRGATGTFHETQRDFQNYSCVTSKQSFRDTP